MKFCPACGRGMVRDTSSGSVVFQCPACLVESPGNPEDARISGSVTGTAETAEMYQRLIASAPQDRTNQTVMRNCPKCGLDYMFQVRVGENEIVVYVCKCGYQEKPN